jgi:predicted RNase H-like HicB family nuclease
MEMPIAIHKDRDSVYGVTIPDVPGCYSWGDTIDEAIKNAKEAIYSHLEVMAESGDVFDIKASKTEDLSKDEEYAGAIWALVDVDASKFDAPG